MTSGTAGEGGALAICKFCALVREKDHVLKVFARFVLALDAGAFFCDVADKVIAAGDALDITTEFFVLNVQAAEKSADIIRISMRQGKAWSFFIELEGVAFLAVFCVGDRELILATCILLVAIGTVQLARHVAFAHVDGVVELEGVGVLDTIADLAKLWVIGVEGVDDIGVAACGSLARLCFGSAAGHIGKFMGIYAGAEYARFCHQFGRAVAGNAVGIVHRRHDAGMFFVAFVTSEIRRHVRLVKIFSLMAGKAFLIHGGGFDGTALEEFCGGEAFL